MAVEPGRWVFIGFLVSSSSRATSVSPGYSFVTLPFLSNPEAFQPRGCCGDNKSRRTAQTSLVKHQRHKTKAPDREESAATHPHLTLTATKHYWKIHVIPSTTIHHLDATALHSFNFKPSQVTTPPSNRPR